MELFEVGTSLQRAATVPEPSAQHIAEARARFLTAIAAEPRSSGRSQESAA